MPATATGAAAPKIREVISTTEAPANALGTTRRLPPFRVPLTFFLDVHGSCHKILSTHIAVLRFGGDTVDVFGFFDSIASESTHKPIYF